MTVQFHLAGGREFLKYLESLPERTSVNVRRRVLKEAAEPMREVMVRLAPYEPGGRDLRDNITISNAKPEQDDLYPTEVGVRVGPTKVGYYGFWSEFGTITQRMKPFMRPAFEQTAPQCLQIISTLMWAAISKARGPVTGIQSGPGRTL